MALVKFMTLEGVGLDGVEVDAYINVQAISIQFRADGMLLHVALNVYASAEARQQNRALIGVENVTLPYNPQVNVNIHTYIYSQVKMLPQFEGARDS